MDIHEQFPDLPESLIGLKAIAENLWWTWHPQARMLYKMLDRQAWKSSGHNPVKMLKNLPLEISKKAAKSPAYRHHYKQIWAAFQNEIKPKSCDLWKGSSTFEARPMVYFSAEYGLHHSLPFYAGGLGFLAGDFLKECSDLAVPLVAIGFMYPEGYVHQQIRNDGWQEDLDQPFDREAASIARVCDETGDPLVVKIPLIDPALYVAVWKIKVGRVPLYLMDTDIDLNDPWNRKISAHLYSGDRELRLRQEIVLGIGGSEVLEQLGVRCGAVHLNEGHATFALLERIRDLVQSGLTFDNARQKVKDTTIFTTHTPVAAGHDVFPFNMMERYFHAYWPSLNLNRDEFFNLGLHPHQPQEGFNMTTLALRLAKFRNGVSRRHGEVSRKMWQCLWPERAEEKVPIGHITNGIHVATWVGPKMALLYHEYLGADWITKQDSPATWKKIDTIPNDLLWRTHFRSKIKLIDAIRELARQRWAGTQGSPLSVVAGGALLDPAVLTLGFARRFAAYKRADLIFHNRERLKKLLNDRTRPIQIIFAGKAHPLDEPGKRILQRVYSAAQDPALGGRVAFVENYGEQFAQYLVHGVDVWLNNPVPPMEACGTSGMKAALNGVPQLSILDGWWQEGFNGHNGWGFGDQTVPENRNTADAGELYRLLEEEIAPLYYPRSEMGVPNDWVGVMKAAIKSSAAQFSARRMVKAYVQQFYRNILPMG